MAFEDIGVNAVIEGMGQFLSAAGEFNSAISGMTGNAEGAAGVLSGVGDIAGAALNAGFQVAQAGAQALAQGFQFAFGEAVAGEQTLQQLETVLRSTGGAAGLTIEQAQALGDQFAHLAGGSDDAILAIETIGIRAGTISAEQMPQFIESVLDLGTVMGSSTTAAQLLARAQEDPVGALTRLQRATGVYDLELKENVKTMVEAGDSAGATQLIMDSLATSVGGAAADAAGTLAGRWEVLQGRIGEAAEEIGAVFIPIAHDLFDNVIAPAIPLVEEFATTLASAFESVMSGDLGGALDALAESTIVQNLLPALGLTTDEFRALAPTIEAAARALVADLIEGAQQSIAALQPLIDAAINVADSFMDSMPMIIQAVGIMVDFVLDQIHILAPTLIANVTTMLNTIADFWDAHGATIMAIVVLAFQVITTTIGGALTLASGLVTAALQLMTGDFSGAGATISATVTAFMNAVLAIVGTNLEAFKATWAGNWELAVIIVTTTWANIVAAVQAQAAALLVTVLTGMINIIAGINGMVADFTTAGANLIAGVAAGITGGIQGVIDAAVGAVMAAVNAAKAAAGIRSPSELAAKELGEPFALGIGEGIERKLPEVQDTVEDFFDALIGGPGGIGTQMLEQIAFEGELIMQDLIQIMGDRLNALREQGSVFAGVGGTAAGIFKKQKVDPLKEQVKGLNAQLKDLSKQREKLLKQEDGGYQTLYQLVALEDQMNTLQRERAGLLDKQVEAEKKLAEFEDAKQRLDFLNQQVKLLDLISEHGLDAGQILQGMTLGVNASVEELMLAMARAIEGIIAQTQSTLQLGSPSRVFAKIGRDMMTGWAQGIVGGVPLLQTASALAAQSTVTTATNVTYNYSPTYGSTPHQPTQDYAVMQALAR